MTKTETTSPARPAARTIDSLTTDARIHMATAADIIEHILAGTLRDGVGGTDPDALHIAAKLTHAANLLTTAAAWVAPKEPPAEKPEGTP